MKNKNINLKVQSFLCMSLSYIIFLFLYEMAGKYSSALSSVPSFYFRWEEDIPFIPWMIIPYISSGIFFICVFFVCKTKESLYTLVKRINFITIVSAVSFFVFPLKFAFEKPEVKNIFFNFFFQFLERMDTDFNQCPSLHISYAVIFTIVFYKEIKSKAKYLFCVWFFLLGLSTIFIYQHHVIDVIFSLGLTLFTIFIFPERDNKRNRKVGFIYFLLSFILFTIGLIFFNWTRILLWSSLSFFLVGKAYAENNSEFLKKDGKIALHNKIIHLPYLLCYNILWRYFRKYENEPWKEIAPDIFIGSKLNNEEAEIFLSDKKVIVIDLAAESEENNILKRGSREYHSFPLLDICNLKEDIFLSALELAVEKYKDLKENEKIYIHCLMGYSRSAALGSAFLKKNYHIESKEAVFRIKKLVKNAVIPDYILDNIKEC